MYSESLITPHPRKLSVGEQPELLSDIVDASTVELQRTASMRAGIRDVDINVGLAEYISWQTNRALWFPRHEYPDDDFKTYGISDPPKLSAIEDHQVANCFGYTLVLSELLQEASIAHRIGYMAYHAFVLLDRGDADNEDLWYVDALWPDLNQEMQPHLSRRTESEILPGRVNYFVDAAQFVRGANQDLQETILTRNWPVAKSSQIRSVRLESKDDRFVDLLYRQRLVMSTFPSEIGCRMLKLYSAFDQAIAVHEYDVAYDSLIELGPLMPEIDVRSDKHRQIYALVAHESKNNRTERALKALERYFSGFDATRHPSVQVMKGDLLRNVSEWTDDLPLAQAAIQMYQAAEKRQHHKTASGRLAAAIALRDRLLAND